MKAAKIIERVKNADNLSLTGDAYWRSVILVTLDAIREPSEAQIAAGSPYLTLTGAWRAMIDARKREIAG